MGFCKRTSGKKRVCFLLTLCLLLTVFCLPVSGEESAPPALVSQEYLQKQLEALRQELLEAIEQAKAGFGGDTPAATLPPESDYRDVTLPRGSVLTLGADAEVIFRGGYAVVLTVSEEAGAGITELATEQELFSGALLQFARIYYKSTPESHACVLVTGDKAAFTLKGTYEIS